MALAAQGQRSTTNQQQPNFNWAQVAGPPGGFDDGGQMALTMPMPAAAPQAGPSVLAPMPAPLAMPVVAPVAAPALPPSDVVYQQMYAPAPQEMVQMPAPVYSMIPAAPQSQPQMEPINFPQPSMADLAAYEMYGAPTVPVAGYSPQSQAPIAPQQFSWQPMAEQAQPVGYNPMLMDAAAMELYGAPSQAPAQPAAVPTQFAFDPASLTGATGSTFMQAPTAMPQPMMAGGPPQQNLAPLPPPPSMYVPRQQQEVAGMAQPGVGATMPYQPMVDLGVSQEELYNMFAGMAGEQPLAMMSRGEGDGIPRMAEPIVLPSRAQPLPAPPVTPPSPIGGEPRTPEQTAAEAPAGEQPAQQQPGQFARGFKPFDIPVKGREGQTVKVTSYDPKTGQATLQFPNTNRSVTINRANKGAADYFASIDQKYNEQQTEQLKVGPGNYKMLPEMPGMPLRIAVEDPENPQSFVWAPARQTGSGLEVEYYDPILGVSGSIGLSQVRPEDLYDPNASAEAMTGEGAINKLRASLVPALKENTIGNYERELKSDDRSYYSPDQLARMVQVEVKSYDANGIPTYEVQPITTFAEGVEMVDDGNGNEVPQQFAREIADPRVPPGFLEKLQESLDRRVAEFKTQGEINDVFIKAKPQDLVSVLMERLEKSKLATEAERDAFDVGSKEYKAKQKEVDAIEKRLKDLEKDPTIDVGDGTLLGITTPDLRVSTANPRSWDTLIRQVSGALPSTGPGSQARAGLYISPQEYAQNFAKLEASSANYSRGKSLEQRRTKDYTDAANKLLSHLENGIQEAAGRAAANGPKALEQFVSDMYNEPSAFIDTDPRDNTKTRVVSQTFAQAVGELTQAQASMNQALASGETKRIANAEENLKRKFNKLRGGIRLPNNDVIQMDEKTYNDTSIDNAYEASNVFDPSVAGRETQVERMDTLKADRPEGFSDRPASGTKTPNPTSIRPVIMGAGGKGFYGDANGVVGAASSTPEQWAHLVMNIANPSAIAAYSKQVMSAGMYGETAGHFTDPANEAAAKKFTKAANRLMLENSPQGKAVRKAYGESFYNMLAKSGEINLAVGAGTFGEMLNTAFETGDPGPILRLVEGKNLTNILGRFGSSKLYQGINGSTTSGYFRSGKSPQESYVFLTGIRRVKNLAKAIVAARSQTDAQKDSDIGMQPIGGDNYVFFATPWAPPDTLKSLLAIPSVDDGGRTGSGGATILDKKQLEDLDNKGQLPTSANPYDIPAAYLLKHSPAIFGPLGETLTQELAASSDDEVKDIIAGITARQKANHRTDMTPAAERRGSPDNNTKLDADAQRVGRRWVTEGQILYNVLFPTRNTGELR